MSRPQRFDLIAFDWDGTLFDSTALITRSIQSAAVDLGLPRPSDAQASYVIGMGLQAAMAHAVPALPEARFAEMGERFRHHYLAAQHEVILFAGVVEMLAALKARHHWLTVATGKSRRGLDEALQAVGLDRVFDGSRTADQTQGKPHPQMLLELMREFGAEPERTLMVGDTSHDLQLALNAGCASVGVSYGAHDHHSFAEFKPLHIAHDVADLQQWLLANA
ncbi:HAD family hydrolase [Paucibacter sp. DJ2R-2]|uniref:HAD family hydrolase n=1 Tax=Paucibacter sp. DJ2R-2 TaxID=2893558 RepID=UPI0021E44CFA|nr:HAD-IA family hydrolase [Paucibacter sp. DJ2R-2]MCV2423065.1 HAD-IA family hydrolase [Paucibacter sp. DJ4R-1]MCV2440961.1 HAD-IA family hydrolase [Paucibacter sp. DJ2R-2]